MMKKQTNNNEIIHRGPLYDIKEKNIKNVREKTTHG